MILFFEVKGFNQIKRSKEISQSLLYEVMTREPEISTKTGWPEEAVVTGKNGVLVNWMM